MKARWRVPVLLAVLLLSVVLLVREPRDVLTTEAHWHPVPGPSQGAVCPPPLPAEPMEWRLRLLPGSEPGFRDMLPLAQGQLGPQCNAPPCRRSHEVLLAPRWRHRPGYFDGLAQFELELELLRSGPECHERARWSLQAEVDQGRRGRERVALAHLGRMVGNFLRTQWGGGDAACAPPAGAPPPR